MTKAEIKIEHDGDYWRPWLKVGRDSIAFGSPAKDRSQAVAISWVMIDMLEAIGADFTPATREGLR